MPDASESTQTGKARIQEGKVRFICPDERAPTLAVVLDALRTMPIPVPPLGVVISSIRIDQDSRYVDGKYVRSGSWAIAIDWEMVGG